MRQLQPSLSPLRTSQVARRLVQAAACGVCALWALSFAAASVQAQAEPSADPGRYLAFVSAGVPLRLTVDDTYGQRRFAPAFGNVLLGYALPGGRLRHGFGLGVSWNITHDGGYTDPIYAGDQIAVMPSYLAYYQMTADVIGIGHAGIPIVVRGGPSWGVEAGAALAYRVFAGAGLFAALDLDAYAAGSFALLASLELGLMLDYEVLP